MPPRALADRWKSVVHSPAAYQDDSMLHLPFFLRSNEWKLKGDVTSDFEPTGVRDWFGNENRVCMEIGSGFGEWVVGRAIQDPDTNWIAVEKRGNRVLSMLRRIAAAGVQNVKVVSSDVHAYMSHCLPNQSVSGVYVNFPDPWPKKKHTKRRLMRGEFLRLVADKLEHGGTCHTVTDSEDLNEEMKISFNECISDSGHRMFLPELELPWHASSAPENYGTTVYMTLWKAKGRPELYMKWSTGQPQQE
eukprot:TRINITY_DN26140_c0_g1_i2.p1 TRINITY_DN26140_c0_g1~~TRINITY_DN26140_c0_g1_i2.p1  ORF type:complete len:247 (-),score=39.84 TRINITY_DN26140_c0_g1_i2:545-1285(-)